MKKRIFKAAVWILAMLFALTLTAFAASEVTYEDTYDVWVSGVQITESKADDVLGDGTVKYDVTTGTLTLTDATIDNTNGDGIKVIGSDITVVGVDTDAEGSNTISGSTTAVYGSANITMKGAFGDITGGTNGAIYSVVGSSPSYPGGTIHIEEETVIGNISSSWYTLQADKGDIIIDGKIGDVSGAIGFTAEVNGDIIINGKVGNVSGTEYGMYAHKTITIAEGAEVGNISADGTAGLISFESDITITGKVGEISGMYGVYAMNAITIGGEVASIEGQCGLFAASGDITLSGDIGAVTGNGGASGAGNSYGIRANTGKIVINSIIGTVSASSTGEDVNIIAMIAKGGIDIADNIEITTPTNNKIDLYGTSNYAVYDTDDNTVAKTVVLSEERYNVYVESGEADKAEYGEGETVTITADYPRTGTSFKEWTTDDGVTFADKTSQETTFIMPAKDVTVTATYETAYDIRIGNKAITPGNKDDVLGDGTVKFDPETNTLTLSGANIASIESGIQNITLKLAGENTVSGYITLGSSSSGCVTITSVDTANKGSLKASDINSPGGYYLNLVLDSVSYTGGFSNANVSLRDTLTIKNSDVTTNFMMWMSGTTYEEVGYGGIVLENSTLTASDTFWAERLTIDDNSVLNMNAVLTNYGGLPLTNALGGIVDHLPSGYNIAFHNYTNTIVDADGEPATNIIITRRYTVTVENGTGSGRYAKGETVTIKADAPTSGKTFKIWTANDSVTFANSTNAETTFVMPAKDVTVTAAYKTTQSSQGSTGSSSYTVTVKDSDGGDVSASHKKAKSGVTVTVTASPDDGYAIDTVTVTDKNGKEIEVTGKGNGKYTFDMPSSKVTVTVTFKSTSDGKHICPSEAFDDLDTSAWYHAATDYVLANELMKGMDEKIFAPDISTSRAMIVTILWRLEGSPVVNYLMTFEDVETDAWYTEAVRWAASENIVEGYSDAAFGPDDSITREQLATMLYRYIQYKGGGFKGTWMFLLDYTDRDKVSEWAYEAVCYMTMHELIKGKNDRLLDPKGNATRAEVAQLFMNYLENE